LMLRSGGLRSCTFSLRLSEGVSAYRFVNSQCKRYDEPLETLYAAWKVMKVTQPFSSFLSCWTTTLVLRVLAEMIIRALIAYLGDVAWGTGVALSSRLHAQGLPSTPPHALRCSRATDSSRKSDRNNNNNDMEQGLRALVLWAHQRRPQSAFAALPLELVVLIMRHLYHAPPSHHHQQLYRGVEFLVHDFRHASLLLS
jgi:hypothetical protein